MALSGTAPGTIQSTAFQTGKNYLVPLVLVTSLFFLWGMAYGLLDVLNKHFQETLNVTKTRSTLLQAAYFGAYFLIAIPAGNFMNRYGYKKGIIAGLLLYSIGAFLFYPAAEMASFNFFLVALFVLASGLACLETAANPYITILGPPGTSAFRLNLAQCFNGVGAFIGPIIAGRLFFQDENGPSNLDSVQTVYIIIGAVVFLIAIIFFRTPLPEISEGAATSVKDQDKKPLFAHRHFTGAVVAQFFYVAAQVGIAALFINYCTEAGIGIDNERAAYLLGTSLLLFTIGRFTGTFLMKKIPPNTLLAYYGVINVALCAIVILGKDWLSVYSLMALFFFQSIMFPTIFALGVKDLGHHTKKASSFLIMSIVGGALVPYFMGMIADNNSTSLAFIIPAFCFIIVAWYGFSGYKVKMAVNPREFI